MRAFLVRTAVSLGVAFLALAAPALAGDAGRQVLWTQQPVRVAPEAQDLKRLPDRGAFDPYPMQFFVKPFVRVPDSVTFTIDDVTYRLFNIEPVPARMICRDLEGRRFACGLRARMTLRAMIAGKVLNCRRIDGPREAVVYVSCAVGADPLAESLVRAGAARAVVPVPPHLAEAQAFALGLRIGLWSDAETANAARAAN